MQSELHVLHSGSSQFNIQNSECIKISLYWWVGKRATSVKLYSYIISSRRRNARRKNDGPQFTFHFLSVSTSVQVVIPGLESMKRGGIYANAVRCASVHIKKNYCTNISMPNKLHVRHLHYVYLNLERQVSAVEAGFHAPNISGVVSSLKTFGFWTYCDPDTQMVTFLLNGNIKAPGYIQSFFTISATSVLLFFFFVVSWWEHNSALKNIPKFIICK